MSCIPIKTAAQTDLLNTEDVIAGYHDGRAGEPEPGDNRSFSYWHGWRNGAADAGHRQIDSAQRELARDYLARERARRRA
jgi:chitinase